MASHGNDLFKFILTLVVFVVFLGIGIGHVVKPDWFMKRSGVRRGGEMFFSR